jgi:hypothetical protein
VCKQCGAVITAPHAAIGARPSGAGAPAGRDPQLPGEDPALAQLQRSVAEFYKVERTLGRGRMTVVYQAAGLNPPRPVALKVLPRGLGFGPAANRFKDEVKKAQALSHPNVLPIYTIGLRAGAPYFIAMKLVEGQSLDAAIGLQGALPLPAVIVVLRATAEALNYAHGRGTIHGNLTAANILLDRNGRAVVSDFGIARALEEALPAAAGKPRSLSPEEAAGGAAGPLSDQYFLGMMTLQMLTGSMSPDTGPISMRDLGTGRGGPPEALVHLVRTALAADPADRYASMSDMLVAIRAIPFSEADRREGYAALAQLAKGEPLPKPSAPASAPRRESTVARGTASPEPVRRASPAAPAAPAARPISATRVEKAVTVEPAAAAAPAAAAPAPPAPPAPPPPPAEEPAPVARAARPTPTVNFVFAAPAEPAPKWHLRLVWALAALLVTAGIVAAAFILLGRRPAASPVAQAPKASPAPSAPASSGTDAPRSDTTRRPVAAADGSRTDAGSVPETTGLLLLTVVPPTADVLVDGTPTGSDGFVDSEVTAGRRRLRISAQGYLPLDTLIRVAAGGTVDLGQIALRESAAEGANLAPQTAGRLRLRALPPTAEIFVDGRPAGVGSLVDFEVAAGPRQLRISAAGYLTLDTLITVVPGATVRLGQITLKSAPGGP